MFYPESRSGKAAMVRFSEDCDPLSQRTNKSTHLIIIMTFENVYLQYKNQRALFSITIKET